MVHEKYKNELDTEKLKFRNVKIYLSKLEKVMQEEFSIFI